MSRVRCAFCERLCPRSKSVDDFRRDLCDRCRRDPLIARLFAPPPAIAPGLLPDVPTDAHPLHDRERRLKVMSYRAHMGQRLCHPDDAGNIDVELRGLGC